MTLAEDIWKLRCKMAEDFKEDRELANTEAKAMPLEDLRKIRLSELERKTCADSHWQVSDNAPRNLPEPSTEAAELFMTTGMDGDE